MISPLSLWERHPKTQEEIIVVLILCLCWDRSVQLHRGGFELYENTTNGEVDECNRVTQFKMASTLCASSEGFMLPTCWYSSAV